jgi:hypothetical protein
MKTFLKAIKIEAAKKEYKEIIEKRKQAKEYYHLGIEKGKNRKMIEQSLQEIMVLFNRHKQELKQLYFYAEDSMEEKIIKIKEFIEEMNEIEEIIFAYTMLAIFEDISDQEFSKLIEVIIYNGMTDTIKELFTSNKHFHRRIMTLTAKTLRKYQNK